MNTYLDESVDTSNNLSMTNIYIDRRLIFTENDEIDTLTSDLMPPGNGPKVDVLSK